MKIDFEKMALLPQLPGFLPFLYIRNLANQRNRMKQLGTRYSFGMYGTGQPITQQQRAAATRHLQGYQPKGMSAGELANLGEYFVGNPYGGRSALATTDPTLAKWIFHQGQANWLKRRQMGAIGEELANPSGKSLLETKYAPGLQSGPGMAAQIGADIALGKIPALSRVSVARAAALAKLKREGAGFLTRYLSAANTPKLGEVLGRARVFGTLGALFDTALPTIENVGAATGLFGKHYNKAILTQARRLMENRDIAAKHWAEPGAFRRWLGRQGEGWGVPGLTNWISAKRGPTSNVQSWLRRMGGFLGRSAQQEANWGWALGPAGIPVSMGAELLKEIGQHFAATSAYRNQIGSNYANMARQLVKPTTNGKSFLQQVRERAEAGNDISQARLKVYKDILAKNKESAGKVTYGNILRHLFGMAKENE